jgi:hypothetical protein
MRKPRQIYADLLLREGVPGAGRQRSGLGTGAAPMLLVAPELSGMMTHGSTLTCTTGAWTGMPTSYQPQWYRGSSPIAGETAFTYEVGDEDFLEAISCRVVATNEYGNSSPEFSNATESPYRAFFAALNPATECVLFEAGFDVRLPGDPCTVVQAHNTADEMDALTTPASPSRTDLGWSFDGVLNRWILDSKAYLLDDQHTVATITSDTEDANLARWLWTAARVTSGSAAPQRRFQLTGSSSPSIGNNRYYLADVGNVSVDCRTIASRGPAAVNAIACRCETLGTVNGGDVLDFDADTQIAGLITVPSGANAWDYLTIGAGRWGAASQGNYFIGELRLIMVCNERLSDAQLAILKTCCEARGIL